MEWLRGDGWVDSVKVALCSAGVTTVGDAQSTH